MVVLVNILWCLVTGVISAVLYVLWYQKYSRFFKLLNEIPGSKGYPIIGTPLAYHVPTDKFFAHAHEVMNRYYPICKDWSFTVACVHLFHPDDVEVVLTSTKNNDKGILYYLMEPWLGTGLLTSPKSKWHKRRKILTPSFHFKILQEFVNIFNARTVEFVDVLKKECDKPYTEVTSLVTVLTLKSITETAMGINLDETEQLHDYKEAIHKFSESLAYRLFRPWFYPYPLFSLSISGRTTKAAIKVLHGFSKNVISERKKTASLTQDSNANKKKLAMLDLLLKAQQDGEDIDDDGIREEVDTFMFEGHDTTAMAISSLLLLIANNKDVQEKLHDEVVQVLGDDRTPTFDDFKELPYTEMCIKEGLRLFPSVHGISRVATCDIKTPTGYTIPKNANIGIHVYDIHRNPEFWPDPEKFDPDRFLPEACRDRHPYAYLPFSAGQRNCIGQKFALLEMKAVLCGVIRKYRLEPIEAHTDLTMSMGMILRPLGEGYKVKFKPR